MVAEDTPDNLTRRLKGAGTIRVEAGGESGLGVGERDAQGVQDGLVGWVVVAEVGGERGGLDGGALRELRAACGEAAREIGRAPV